MSSEARQRKLADERNQAQGVLKDFIDKMRAAAGPEKPDGKYLAWGSREEYEQAFAKADVVAMPASPMPAFRLGEKTADPLQMYLCDVYTIPTNLAGHPGMSVPFGTGAADMPVGVQVLAGTLREPVMFRAAALLEAAMKGDAQ